jgi:putative hydrolase of the HAD superfamily
MSKPLDSSNINAVIFDIGNVIIDIDYDAMVSEFKKIAKFDFREIIQYTHQDRFFDQFEKGEISAADFRSTLRQYLKDETTDEQIDHAWNSILVAYPTSKFELLRRLRSKYKVYALSNINEIHLDGIDRYVKPAFGVADMRSFFDHAYYSHEMGLRKPEKEIYQAVIDHAGLDPSRTLFIDDKAENTEAASAHGLQVYHLTDRDSLLEVLNLF